MNEQIRSTRAGDLDGLKEVLDSSELFPSEYLDELIAGYLTDPETEENWFTGLQDGQIVGLGYCIPEKLTEGTYNLLAIAVRKELQGKGWGKRMMEYIEGVLIEKSARVLIVETSGDDQYASTRKFYETLGYRKEAVIRDFWKEGEDKVVYWKKLS